MIPSAAPYSATWNTERQVATRSPLIERAFFCLRFDLPSPCHAHCRFILNGGYAMTWRNTPMPIGRLRLLPLKRLSIATRRLPGELPQQDAVVPAL